MPAEHPARSPTSTERRPVIVEVPRETGAVSLDSRAKAKLADAAYATLTGGETIFLDASSAASLLARRIIVGGLSLRIVTNSAQVMRLVATAETSGLELHAVGGRLCRNTASYVGAASLRSIRELFADKAFIGGCGVAPDGLVTIDDRLEAAVRRAMLEQAEETTLLLGVDDLGLPARAVIAPLAAITLTLAHGLTGPQAEQLQAQGTPVRRIEKERH